MNRGKSEVLNFIFKKDCRNFIFYDLNHLLFCQGFNGQYHLNARKIYQSTHNKQYSLNLRLKLEEISETEKKGII